MVVLHRLVVALLALCLPAWRAVGQTNFTVSVNDASIDFEPANGWVDQENGQYKYAVGPGSSFHFSFTGSSIYYHSVIDPNGGVASIQLDNGPATLVDESADATKGASPQPAVLWSKSGLDDTASHTLNVSYAGSGRLGGGYVAVYYLEYTTGSPVTSADTTSSASSNLDTHTIASTGTTTATSAGSTPSSAGSPSSPSNPPTNSPTTLVDGTSASTLFRTAVSTAISTSVSTFVTTALGASGGTLRFPSASNSASASTNTSVGALHGSGATSDAGTKTIVGGVVGGVCGLLVILAIIFVFLRLRKRAHHGADPIKRIWKSNLSPVPFPTNTREASTGLSKWLPESIPLSPTSATPLTPSISPLMRVSSQSPQSHSATALVQASAASPRGRDSESSSKSTVTSQPHTGLDEGRMGAAAISSPSVHDELLRGHDSWSMSYMNDPPPVYDGRRNI